MRAPRSANARRESACARAERLPYGAGTQFAPARLWGGETRPTPLRLIPVAPWTSLKASAVTFAPWTFPKASSPLSAEVNGEVLAADMETAEPLRFRKTGLIYFDSLGFT
jgi:hypothetical protein